MPVEEDDEKESQAKVVNSRIQKNAFGRRMHALASRYRTYIRAGEFGVAGAIGFLVAEAIIFFGMLAFYGRVNPPSVASSSPTLLSLNVAAFVVGVTVAFFVNEEITIRNSEESIGRMDGKSRSNSVAFRLLKFQGVYAVGNGITIAVQLALLSAVSLSPVLGNIVGAIVAFPFSYFISMRFVWKISHE